MIDWSSLNPEQKQAVRTTDGPVLILAGAGTGKTRVITARVAHLIHSGVAPAHILAVTFTNKAAREMQTRVRALLPRRSSRGSEDRPTMATFHSLCVRILRRHIDRLGYKRDFVIYDDSDQIGVIRKILSHISAKGERVDPREVLAQLSRLRNQGNGEGIFSTEQGAAMAEHIRVRYESALRACNAVDFDDLILLVLRLFAEHPDVLTECRARYQYVMVDEYQDTNAAQFRLVHSLTEEHRNLCVVGDDDQSIYGWRGAEIANLLDMERYYPEVKVVKLERNYRSTQTILESANALIRNNPRRREKQLRSQQGQGDLIQSHCFDNEDEEARNLVEEIVFLRQNGQRKWEDMAILFRTNGQSRPWEMALRQAHVPYRLVGGQSFFDRREIRDFLAFLKMMVNPDDDMSLLRIANVPARGLSDRTMESLMGSSHEHRCSVFRAMHLEEVTQMLHSRSAARVQEFVALVNRTRQPLSEEVSLRSWAQGFMDEIGYWGEIRRMEKQSEAAENRLRNLKDLIGSMDDVGSKGSTGAERLLGFLEEITLDSEREAEEDATSQGITLITMHSCKGLEFPHVYVAGVEEGLIPHARSAEEGTLDEERRLFYVAITRAMRTLTLSHCLARKKYGNLMPCHPSRFLKELPQHLIEDATAKGKKAVDPSQGKAYFDSLRALLDD